MIPIFFRHGRYTSFARQVNGWGFRRITHGSDFNSYYHEVSSLQHVPTAMVAPWDVTRAHAVELFMISRTMCP